MRSLAVGSVTGRSLGPEICCGAQIFPASGETRVKRWQRLLIPGARETPATRSNPMTKTYSNKSNTIRAAKAVLGETAQPGVDFELIFRVDGWTFESIEAQTDEDQSQID